MLIWNPLESNDVKQGIRYETFCSSYSFMSLFCEVSNGSETTFKDALKFVIAVTYRLAHST